MTTLIRQIVSDGSVAYVDNSGALVVNGEIEYLYARDGGDAAGVEGAGTVAIADPSAIEVPEDYKLVETADGVYAVVAKEYVAANGDNEYIFLDGIARIAGQPLKEMECVFESIAKLEADYGVKFVITCSADKEDLPEFVLKHV